MRVSVNEVLLTVLKAARGCGLREGLCEDLARAAAWLCGHGMDGLGAALAAMESPGARAPAACAVQPSRWVFDPASAAVAGPSALDLVIATPARTALLARLDAPLLLLGLAGVAAHDHGRGFALSGAGGSGVVVTAAAIGWTDPGAPLLRGDTVLLEDAGQRRAGAPLEASRDGVVVDDGALERVRALAARTLVPASDASRVHGAGAGLVDTD